MSIRKYIPDAITSLNLACGAVGVVMAAYFKIEYAFLFMLGGAVFDFFDGFSARMLGAYSPMGKELDSLADDITFGLLPAFMLYQVMPGGVWAWFPLLIAVFSGLRLAKFNIDERQTTSFLGLPTPGCAMVCGSFAAYIAECPASRAAALVEQHPWVIAIASVVFCYLLICEIPMFSMKIHKGEGMSREMRCRISFAIVAAIGLLVVIGEHKYWTLAIFFAFTGYILINLINAPFTKKQE